MSISTYFQGNPQAPRRKNIFISYREKDTAGETGRLVDSLKQYFHEDQIFMDIDKIEPGVDFTDVISHSLENCDVMLAVIGPNWASIKSTNSNLTRIKDPNDWVRLEIATALQRNIRVVPVLVDGAVLPNTEELPEDLQPLLRRQAYEISNKRWRYDTENLVAFLEKSLGIPTKNRNIPITPVSKTSPVVNILKYSMLGLGGIFVLMVLYYAIAGTGDANIDPPKYDTGVKKNIVPVDQGNDYDEPVDPQNEPVNPKPAETNVSPMNVDGVWDDRSGVYYLDIVQDGRNIKLATYSLTGQQTGEGSGTVSGNKLTYKIYFFNVGSFDFETHVNNDGNSIEGTFIVENNGARYSEPIFYQRRN